MALKKITETPKITDTILFELETPDGTNCFVADPFKVDTVIIYFVERDFLGSNWGDYDQLFRDEELVTAVAVAQEAVCADPSVANLFALEEAKNTLESSQLTTTFYYKDRSAVEVIGTAANPAWLSTDTTNSRLVKTEEDEDGNPLFGHFTFEWTPEKSREGDYFICWTWTPLPAGAKLSAHLPFSIAGDPKAVTTIPTHFTEEGKYETLLERYLPEMYKSILTEGDLTPETTLKFNRAVGDGFTFIEDFANQIIDLFDANALHESLLVYLSNLFNLRLKSNDPTLWRRQIKEAIPLFKKKGTHGGIKDAFAQSGITLNTYTQFWQIVSSYTWQESFKVDNDACWVLAKENIVTPIDTTNFGLWLRRAGSETYTPLNQDYVEFTTDPLKCTVTMCWIGDELSISPITLANGDFVRVLYEYNEVPDAAAQQLEDYIRLLPLADLRDEADQNYPLKNWNVRLIDEGDALFDILIPVRHPFHDPLVFGFIRTEFPYGENIYNMEEYNGSTRPSFDACNIGKEFLDPCGACLSSKYSVDISVEEISNDRMVEAQDILDEYMPFHAQLHSINFNGDVTEFVTSPVEDIDFLVTIDRSDNFLSGQANPFFHRVMEGGQGEWIIDHDDLAEKTTVLSGKLGTGYNDHVIIIVPDHDLNSLGINPLGEHILEVLAPSANAGTYLIDNFENSTARISTSVVEPLDQSQFTFQLSNVNYGNTTTSITQDDQFRFSDTNVVFEDLGVKTLWDVANVPDYTGGAWKVSIPSLSATPYVIDNIVNGELILVDDGTLPLSGTFTYTLENDLSVTEASSTTGDLETDRRGLVDLNDVNIINRDELFLLGDLLFHGSTEYEIIEFTDSDKFYIAEWVSGDVVGASIEIRRRLISSAVGQFGYRGLHLTTFADHEAEFSIVNGLNPPAVITDDNAFKENYMFMIGTQFFRILEWDKKEVVLAGREQVWTTLVAGGTTVAYKLVHFPKNQVNVQFTVFDHIDRDGHDVVIRTIEDLTDMNQAIVALSAGPSSGIQEQVGQDEGISFIIETQDGQTEEGEI